MRRKVIITLSILFICGVVLLALFLRFGQFNERLRAMAVEQASAELKHPVEIDRLTINLFPAYVDIKGFRIKDAGGLTLFSAQTARGYLSFTDILLRKKIDLRQVAVDDPQLTVLRPAGADFNITPLIREVHRLIVEPPRIPYRVIVRAVQVQGGAVGLDDAVANVKGTASGIGGSLLKRGEDYQLSVKTDKGRIMLADGKDLPFTVDGRMKSSGDRVDLDSLTVSSNDSRLELSGQIGEAGGVTTFNGNTALQAQLDEWQAFFPALQGIGGSLAVKAEVKGPVDNLAAEGKLKGDITAHKPLLENSLTLSGISAGFHADRNSLKLSGLTASMLGGQVKGDAGVAKDERGEWVYKAAGDLERGDLRALQTLFAGKDLVRGGTITARVEATGNIRNPSSARGKIDFAAAPVMTPAAGLQGVFTSGISKVAGTVQFAPEGFVLEQGQVSSPLYSLAARGSVGKDRLLRLSVSCRVPEVMPMVKAAGYEKLRGEGQAAGVITGTLDSPIFNGRAVMKNALWNEVPIASADGDLTLSKEKLTSPRITLIQGKGIYVFNGEIRFDKEVFYDARVRIKDGDPRQVTRIFYKDLPLSMAASGELSFKGTAKEFSGDGFLEAPRGSAWGQEFDSLAVRARLLTDRIRFPSLAVKRGNANAIVSGEIDWDGGYSVSLKAEGVDPAVAGLSGKEFPVQGVFSVKLWGKGRLEKPVLNLEAETPGLRYQTASLGKGRLEGVLEGGHLKANLRFQGLGLQANGDLSLDGNRAWSMEANLKDCKLDPFLPLMNEKLSGVAMSATGVITASGEGANRDALRGTSDLSSVKADVEGYQVSNSGPLRMTVQGDEVTIQSVAFRGKGTAFDIVGKLRMGSSYDLLFRGEAEVSLLKTFFKRVEGASGNSELVLSIEGPWDDPDTTGILHVADGQLKVKDVKYRITDLDAVFMFSRDEVILQSFKAMAGGGTFTGSGQVLLKQFKPESIFLTLKAGDFRYRYEDALTASLNAALFYEKTKKGQLISGDVTINSARYTKRVDWKSAVLAGRGKGGIPELRADVPIIGEAALNVHCVGHEKFVIDNNLARIPVTVDLYVRGTVNRPHLMGRLEAMKGTVYLRGTDYTINSAIIEFSDPDRIYPAFNISAGTAVRDYKVTMNLVGNMDRFSMNLQSDPPLPDIDVIGLLTVGKTGAELGGGEGGMAAGEAVSFVTGQIQDVMEERVKKITGFDRFQVDPYAGGIQSSGGARLTVGKRLLSDRLLVTYTANIGSTEEQILTMEYKLAKNLSLVGKKDEKGRVKADVRYRFEFR